jgi:hypothetical protein
MLPKVANASKGWFTLAIIAASAFRSTEKYFLHSKRPYLRAIYARV